MLLSIIKPLRLLIKGFLQTDSPRQLAAGMVLGMLLGLVPKGNLFAVIFSVLLLGSQANLVAGAIGTGLCSWLNMYTDRYAHQVGQYLLEHPSLRGYWAKAYELPLAPWTDFNNTVVLGSLVLGLALALPVYWITRTIVARLRPWLAERLQKYRVDDALGHAEKVAGWKLS